jgi:hypothetical protein
MQSKIIERLLSNLEYIPQLGAGITEKKQEIRSVFESMIRQDKKTVDDAHQGILREFTDLLVNEFEEACKAKASSGEDARTQRGKFKKIREATLQYILNSYYMYGESRTHLHHIIQNTSIVHHVIWQLAVHEEGWGQYDVFSHNSDLFYNFAFQLLDLPITQRKFNEIMSDAGNREHVLKAMDTYFEHSLRTGGYVSSPGPSTCTIRLLVNGGHLSSKAIEKLLKGLVQFMWKFTKKDRFRPAVMKLSFLTCIFDILGLSGRTHNIGREMMVLRKLVYNTPILKVLAVIIDKRETPEQEALGEKYRANIIHHVQGITHYILKTDGAPEMELGAQCSGELLWALHVVKGNAKHLSVSMYWRTSLRISIARILLDEKNTEETDLYKAWLFNIVHRYLTIVPHALENPPKDQQEKEIIYRLISLLNDGTSVERNRMVVNVMEDSDEKSTNPFALHIKMTIIHRFFELEGNFNDKEKCRDIVQSLVEVISTENTRPNTSRTNIVLALQTIAFIYNSVSEDLKVEVVRAAIGASAFKHIYDSLRVVYENKLFTAPLANSAFAVLSIIMLNGGQDAIDKIRQDELDLAEIFELTMDRFLQSGHLYIESGDFAFNVMRTLIVSSEAAIALIIETDLMLFLTKVLNMYSFANVGTPDISRVVYLSVASIVKKLMDKIGHSGDCKEFWNNFPYLLVLLTADWSAIPATISRPLFRGYGKYLKENGLPRYLLTAPTFSFSNTWGRDLIYKMNNMKKFVLNVHESPPVQVEDPPLNLDMYYPFNGKKSP